MTRTTRTLGFIAATALLMVIAGCGSRLFETGIPDEGHHASASDCASSYTLRLTFRGILDLVSESGSSSIAWVLVPNLTDPTKLLPPNLPVKEKHYPEVWFDDRLVSARAGGKARKRCYELGNECVAFSLEGIHLDFAANQEWPTPLDLDWAQIGASPTAKDTGSLAWLADMDAIAAQSGNGAVTWSNYTKDRYTGDRLTARVPLTKGALRTSAFWRETDGKYQELEVAHKDQTGIWPRAVAEAFTLELPVRGCTTFSWKQLADESEAGKLSLAAPNGGVLQVVVVNEPKKVESDHFLGHYWLREDPTSYKEPRTLRRVTPPKDNGVCSPGRSET
jgi:hypothetical protein